MWEESNLQMDNVTKQQKQLQMWEESNLQMDNVNMNLEGVLIYTIMYLCKRVDA